MGAQVLSRAHAEKMLIEKATTDSAFRAALLSNPKAAIGGVLGVALPSDLTITVIEESPRSMVLVLPARGAEGVLNDADLREIVGGATKADSKGGDSTTEAFYRKLFGGDTSAADDGNA